MEAYLAGLLERHPRRWLRVVVAGAIPFCLLATGMSLITLTLVFRQPWSVLVPLLAVGLPLSTACVLVTYASVRKRLRPALQWLDGQRDTANTIASWHVLNQMGRIVRRGMIIFCVAYLPFPLYAIDLIDAPLYAYPGIALGAFLAIAWAAMMIRLWFDYSLRAAFVAASQNLPSGFELAPATLSARRKLLFASTVFAAANIALVGGIAFGLDLPPSAALPLFIALALAASFTVARVGIGFMALSMFRPVQDLVDASVAVGQGKLTTRVPVTSRDEFGVLAHSFNEMVHGLAERQAFRSALQSYVDPRLVDRMLAEGELLAGEDVDVTVLFLDIRGFSAFAEVQPPSTTVGYLNDLFARVVPIVASHGGHLNKFTGDGLLAVFGAPERHDDHADRALRAARDIALTMDDLPPTAPRFGIGLNSGSVVAGTVGGGGRLEFAVIGDTVNIAARVEALTRDTGDTVLLTSETKARLRDAGYPLSSRGTHTLRGRSGGTDVYALRLTTHRPA